MEIRKKLCLILKYVLAFCALGGVIFSLFTARRDGYSHWGRRLLYFTAQSNIWIGSTALILAMLLTVKKGGRWIPRLYLLKYVFTVSIVVTGVVFCGLLAPFSAEQNYRPWTVVNLFTHVVTPVLALADFALDKEGGCLNKYDVFWAILPPLAYCFFAVVLEALHTDFGRGVPYPYFFLNYSSPSGFFGFSQIRPFYVGSFYWLVLFSVVVLLLARVLAMKFFSRKG